MSLLAACTTAPRGTTPQYLDLATVTSEFITAFPSTASPPPRTPYPTPTQFRLQKTEPTGKIVFTCQTSFDSQFNNLCIINADGTGWRQLTSALKINYYFASVAPEGNSVIFSSSLNRGHEIFEMNLELDSEPVQLTFSRANYAPEISPDGTRFIYTHNNGPELWDSQIWMADRDGSNHRQVTNMSGGAWDAVWSPDSTQIMYASRQRNRTQLFILDINSSELRQVTDLEGIRGRNAWSPHNLLATYIGDPWHREIAIFDQYGNNIVYLTDGGNNLAPSFSPDGQWIVFTSYRDRYEYHNHNGCEIYIMRIDGSDVRRLTDTQYCDWQPRWGN